MATNAPHLPQPGETQKERVDRELHELLEEIRVALPGVEVLFGFLLILPFSERFAALDGTPKYVYLATLLVTALSTALLIAPTAHHRLGFRTIDKERLLLRTNRQVIVGLGLIAVSMSLVVHLVVSVMFGGVWAAVLAAVIALCFAGWWFVLPSIGRMRDEGVGKILLTSPEPSTIALTSSEPSDSRSL
jgi:hypothetical protein